MRELHTVAYSNAFETELIFSKKAEGGYIFALTLIPRRDLSLAPMRQNYLFLIDRSNSIQKDRLISTKNAVRKALEELRDEDTFNIFVFDSKVDKLSPHPLSYSHAALNQADVFLNRLELGSFFSQSDLFKPLFLTIPSKVEENELYTAILFTDGDPLSKTGGPYSLLYHWTSYNQGRVALFVVGMTTDAHLPIFDAISYFNRGKVTASTTQRGLKRKTMRLMKTIHTPVAKNLSCKAIARVPQNHIEIFPTDTSAPHLYLNEPYVILGQTDSLEDFILFVQGRLQGKWLHIKKNISFLHGKKGHSALQAEWALQKAYGLYENYIADNNPQHLIEARALLTSHDLHIPFE